MNLFIVNVLLVLLSNACIILLHGVMQAYRNSAIVVEVTLHIVIVKRTTQEQ